MSTPRLDIAQQLFHAASEAVTDALRDTIAALTALHFPDARVLYAEPDRADAGDLILRAQRVAAHEGGEVIAGYDTDGMSTSDAWDAFTDLVDPYLDWLAELNEEAYSHGDEVVMVVAPPPDALIAVAVDAHNPFADPASPDFVWTPLCLPCADGEHHTCYGDPCKCHCGGQEV